MPQVPTPPPSLIALDWGTSSLRAWRMDAAGTVLDAREQPWGIRHLPEGGFAAALDAVTAGWAGTAWIACGMVGSRQGWQEVPYVEAPAGLDTLAAGLGGVALDGGRILHLVPGVHNRRGPDVMRGEETQLLGAMAAMAPGAVPVTWVLPGTHSKWAAVRDAAVHDFVTLMTGELYAVLSAHSILGTGMDAAGGDESAFVQGVREARDSGGAGGFSRLFSTRARQLEGRLTAAGSADYLSGLLIGEEYRAMLADGRFDTRAPLQLIGAESLCRRYRRAAALFGIRVVLTADGAAAHGLWRIARRAGLFGAESVSPEQRHAE